MMKALFNVVLLLVLLTWKVDATCDIFNQRCFLGPQRSLDCGDVLNLPLLPTWAACPKYKRIKSIEMEHAGGDQFHLPNLYREVESVNLRHSTFDTYSFTIFDLPVHTVDLAYTNLEYSHSILSANQPHTDLQYLYLNDANLRNLDDFPSFRRWYPNIKVLTLSNNYLSSITDEHLPPSLVSLDISNNELHAVSWYNLHFDQLDKLAWLDISNNDIVAIQASNFPSYLQRLIMTGNKIRNPDLQGFVDRYRVGDGQVEKKLFMSILENPLNWSAFMTPQLLDSLSNEVIDFHDVGVIKWLARQAT